MSPTGFFRPMSNAADLRRLLLQALRSSLAWLLVSCALLCAASGPQSPETAIGARARSDAVRPACPGGKGARNSAREDQALAFDGDERPIENESENESEFDGEAAVSAAPPPAPVELLNSPHARDRRDCVAQSPRRARAPPARG